MYSHTNTNIYPCSYPGKYKFRLFLTNMWVMEGAIVSTLHWFRPQFSHGSVCRSNKVWPASTIAISPEWKQVEEMEARNSENVLTESETWGKVQTGSCVCVSRANSVRPHGPCYTIDLTVDWLKYISSLKAFWSQRNLSRVPSTFLPFN